MFQAPFVSQAVFVEDVMDGNWTIFDAKKRKCCEVTLRNGTRHGPSIQWLPNGGVFREESFEDGLTVGNVLQLDPRGELRTIASFVDGRPLTSQVTNFDHSRVKQSEATFLAPKKVVAAPDDFWGDRFAEFSDVGEPLRHGPWTTWYSNGQVKLEGHYERDQEMGGFTWWYPNGQKAVSGEYRGGQRHGEWTWWHQNGQKASYGAFCLGRETGQWRQWNPDGTLESQIVHDDTMPEETYVEAPAEEPTRIEVAEKPEFAPLPLLK
jgi:antitoxin component YwqK of YwqJK toxin-antitoxin module